MDLVKNKFKAKAESLLRQLAEGRLRDGNPELLPTRFSAEALRLVHELEVHQIELEMQNEELCTARDELQIAVDKYTDLYDFAPMGYLTLAPDGKIKAANLTAAKLLNTERGLLVGQNFSQFATLKSRASLSEFLRKVFAAQANDSCEIELLPNDNTPLFVQIEAGTSASGQECRIALIDISERRTLERELASLHAELASRAAELEDANTSLEAFNYSVSHDLRVPLSIIQGYTELLERICGEHLDEEPKQFLHEIHAGTLRMDSLIVSLLRFSLVSRSELQREIVDMSTMAQVVELELRRSGPERRASFKIAPGLEATGDRELLRVVLDNLLGNAWKYTINQEESVIEFGLEQSRNKPVFYVRDNGSGFDMEYATKLFTPFLRLPGAISEGHGIGLATVERIIRRHGGEIWTKSTPGDGATFYFTLDG